MLQVNTQIIKIYTRFQNAKKKKKMEIDKWSKQVSIFFVLLHICIYKFLSFRFFFVNKKKKAFLVRLLTNTQRGGFQF